MRFYNVFTISLFPLQLFITVCWMCYDVHYCLRWQADYFLICTRNAEVYLKYIQNYKHINPNATRTLNE